MRCTYCDNWIPDQAKFCQTCGNKVEAQRAESKSRVFPMLLAILILAIAGVMIGLLMERRKTATVITQQAAAATPPSEVTSPEPRETPKTSVKRVRFPRRTTVVLRGSIVNDGIDQYVLDAKAGQEMMAHITSPKKEAKFDVYLRDDRSLLAKSGAEDTTDWKGRLPASGDYVVSVHSVGGDTRYTLEVAIPPVAPPIEIAAIEPEAKREATATDQPSTQPRDTAAPIVMTIVNDKITVPPRRFWYQRLEVPNAWPSGRVNGRFRAEGGSGNDIRVYVLDQDGFENFQKGHGSPTYYNSDKVTVGTISTRLGPGTYYLVLDNRDSLVSNKVVSIAVSLTREWSEPNHTSHFIRELVG